MKKTFTIILISLLALSVQAQEKKIKTGWNFAGALPAVTFDSDLGFQYGALAEFFNYGDGTKYPDWLDHTYTEVSRFTKGSGIYRFMFESNHIIPKVQWIADLSYLPDRAYNFFGFNGYESKYNKDWTNSDLDQSTYKSRMFYNIERNQFRFKNDFRGKLSGDHWFWSAGFAFQKFTVDTVNTTKLNKGKSDKLPSNISVPGLYQMYDTLGIFPGDQR